MTSPTNFFMSSVRCAFQGAAVALGQINGDNAPLYGQAAGHVFDYVRARLG